MKQFEFNLINVGKPEGYCVAKPTKNITEVLNELGNEGWQIVGVVPPGGEFGRQGDSDIILQREKQ